MWPATICTPRNISRHDSMPPLGTPPSGHQSCCSATKSAIPTIRVYLSKVLSPAVNSKLITANQKRELCNQFQFVWRESPLREPHLHHGAAQSLSKDEDRVSSGNYYNSNRSIYCWPNVVQPPGGWCREQHQTCWGHPCRRWSEGFRSFDIAWNGVLW